MTASIFDPSYLEKSKVCKNETTTQKATTEVLRIQHLVNHASLLHASAAPAKNQTLSISKPRQELIEYLAGQEELFGQTVSRYNILQVLMELYKLMVENRQLERQTQRQERAYEIEHMKNEEANCEETGGLLFKAAVVSGTFGVLAGGLNIFGFSDSGKWLLTKLQTFISPLEGLEPQKAYEMASNMLNSLSKAQGEMGKVHETYAQGDRTRENKLSHMRQQDGEECTRSLEDFKRQMDEIISQLKAYADREEQMSNHLNR